MCIRDSRYDARNGNKTGRLYGSITGALGGTFHLCKGCLLYTSMRTGFQQLLAFSADESMDIDDILVEAHRLLEGLEDCLLYTSRCV